jgi:hypothetical protein
MMKGRRFWIAVISGFIMACSLSGPLASPSPEGTATAAIIPATATATATPTAAETPTETWTPIHQTIEVKVYFTVAGSETMELRAVSRTVQATRTVAGVVFSTLKELLKGPTDAEKAEGLISWFSPATAGCITGTAADPNGTLWVYFTGLNTIIPNASTSAGSQMLLSELNATVFQFDQIRTVWYLLDGSSAAFWEWLQYEDHAVTRADWAGG